MDRLSRRRGRCERHLRPHDSKAALVERSLAGPHGYGLHYYRALLSTEGGGTFLVAPVEAIGNSLGYAAVATAVALVVGGLAAAALARTPVGRSAGSRMMRGFDALLMLPLGTSAVRSHRVSRFWNCCVKRRSGRVKSPIERAAVVDRVEPGGVL